VALTASILPEDRRRMLEAGMDDHIGKPVQTEEVERVLARWLPVTRRGTGRTVTIPPPPGSAQPATPATSAPVIDVIAFERLADLGDTSFAERIVRLFLADAAERITLIDECLETGDLAQLRPALHALEGICVNVGAIALDRRAREIHEVVRRREDRGEDPLAWPIGPSGLEPLLEATRARLKERLDPERE
jgi:two-component system sensor histidine kinase/response regulator